MHDSDIRHLPSSCIDQAMRLFGVLARTIGLYNEKALIEAERDRTNKRHYDGGTRVRFGWTSALRAAGPSARLSAVDVVPFQ
jgi:hypothetical protein